MVDRERLAARLLATFVEELGEQLLVLDADLLALERDPTDRERARSVFRVVHTLKGAARAAGVSRVETVCHELESELAPVRDRGLSPPLLATLFAAVDTLKAVHAELDGTTGERSAGSGSEGGRSAPAEVSQLPVPLLPHGERSEHSDPLPADRSPVVPLVDVVRVDPARLDALHGLVGSLAGVSDGIAGRTDAAETLADALARVSSTSDASTLRALGRTAAQLARALRDDARALDTLGARIGGAVRGMRLRPVSDVTEGLPRAVRDVATSAGKEVDLVVDGAEVEGDRGVLAALRDPLLHLVRNAVDHGIETPAVRERSGKPRRGTVRIAASVAGDQLRIEVRDDGAGVDETAVRAAAARRGAAPPNDRAAVAEALFEAGLSTRQEVTTVSGRGVGLDAVRSAVARLGGTVAVDWARGRGTWFVIEAPVTLAVLRALVVRVGAQRFAVPTAAVQRVLRLTRADLRTLDGRTVLPATAETTSAQSANGGGSAAPLPVVSLARLLGPPLVEAPAGEHLAAIVVAAGTDATTAATGARRVALVADELLDERELVVRPIERAGHAARFYTGAAVVGEGALVLVLATSAVLAAAASGMARTAVAVRDAPAARPARVLVADDSMTTRALEESVLSAAGYEVVTAVDGADAWRIVQNGGVDVVVSDVEMPRLDGFALCETIRASAQFRTLPVILVTSLDRPEHRARGLAAGADAYVTKSSFDQDALLDTVRQLIGAAR